jgi:hypothetical protein
VERDTLRWVELRGSALRVPGATVLFPFGEAVPPRSLQLSDLWVEVRGAKDAA